MCAKREDGNPVFSFCIQKMICESWYYSYIKEITQKEMPPSSADGVSQVFSGGAEKLPEFI